MNCFYFTRDELFKLHSMGSYNKYEQAVGKILNRFPKAKNVVESGYQRANYILFAEQDFTYSVHDDTKLVSVGSYYGVKKCADSQFVGFYDICPWNQSMDAYLLHQTASHETTEAEASIILFRESGAEIVRTTTAWNYQQGSRAQWHPTRDDILLFNDIHEGLPVTRAINIDDNKMQTYQHPIQAVSPTGTEYISINYQRLDCNSPGYGYGTNDVTPLREPTVDGIRRVSFDGTTELLIPLSALMETTNKDISHKRHYIHHVVYSPDGKRFAFLHRWRDAGQRYTQLIASTHDGDWTTLLEHPQLSHFCWLDSHRLFLSGGSQKFGRGYHIVNVKTGGIQYIAALNTFGDGHPSVSPTGEWIVTDTYPDRTRTRTLILYNLESERTIHIGEFFAPFDFDGSVRCDLHPRWSPDGSRISIDSAHEGQRKSYILNVEELIK